MNRKHMEWIFFEMQIGCGGGGPCVPGWGGVPESKKAEVN